MPEPRALPPPAPSLRHHPQQWQAGTLDVAGLSAAAQALAQQPGFDLALRHFAVCWQQGYDSSPVLNSVMRNNARDVLLLACIEQGWMVSGTGHHYTLQPSFVTQLMQWMGREFVWMHTLACAAYAVCTANKA